MFPGWTPPSACVIRVSDAADQSAPDRRPWSEKPDCLLANRIQPARREKIARHLRDLMNPILPQNLITAKCRARIRRRRAHLQNKGGGPPGRTPNLSPGASTQPPWAKFAKYSPLPSNDGAGAVGIILTETHEANLTETRRKETRAGSHVPLQQPTFPRPRSVPSPV